MGSNKERRTSSSEAPEETEVLTHQEKERSKLK